MVSAEDVARKAGVSRSTVSRVINNYTNVPEKTRLAVLRVVEELGYVPHASARLLAGATNMTIGLYIDNRSNYYDDKISSSSFFAPITTEVIDCANKYGYNVLVTQYTDEDSFGRFRDLFLNRAVAAGIVLGTSNDNEKVLALAEKGFLLGLVDQNPDSPLLAPDSSIVANFDSMSGMHQAVQRLVHLGHRTIAHVKGNTAIFSGQKRYEGYRSALERNGIEYREELVVDGDFSEDGGRSAVRELFSRERPTAIVAANDESAIGALKALDELGLSVPGDVSVIGFDGIDVLRYMKPSLSTVVADKRDLAFRLTQGILAAVEGKTGGTRTILCDVDLAPGETCGQPAFF